MLSIYFENSMTRYEKDLVRIVCRRLGVPYTLDDEKADQQELL